MIIQFLKLPFMSALFLVLLSFGLNITTLDTLACGKIEPCKNLVAQIDPVESQPIEPETESLDSVSETAEEASEPIGEEIEPTEPLDSVSETAGEATESVNSLTEPTESLGSVSETDDEASEPIGAISETADEASENLPFAPEGEETTEQLGAPQELPLGDREAEGRVIGE
ncbi:MAG TPA: hypothetical protein VGA95_04365 [Thermodesulfobacteriota bacterium]|jgi:hypothetical protein